MCKSRELRTSDDSCNKLLDFVRVYVNPMKGEEEIIAIGGHLEEDAWAL